MSDYEDEVKCSDHPLAPHGFNRDASHARGRYVCDCEGWTPDKNVIDYENKLKADAVRDLKEWLGDYLSAVDLSDTAVMYIEEYADKLERGDV